jgi:hypothetical protein
MDAGLDDDRRHGCATVHGREGEREGGKEGGREGGREERLREKRGSSAGNRPKKSRKV